jgi:hypothetical protein
VSCDCKVILMDSAKSESVAVGAGDVGLGTSLPGNTGYVSFWSSLDRQRIVKFSWQKLKFGMETCRSIDDIQLKSVKRGRMSQFLTERS